MILSFNDRLLLKRTIQRVRVLSERSNNDIDISSLSYHSENLYSNKYYKNFLTRKSNNDNVIKWGDENYYLLKKESFSGDVDGLEYKEHDVEEQQTISSNLITSKTLNELLKEIRINVKLSVSFGAGITAFYGPLKHFLTYKSVNFTESDLYILLLCFFCIFSENVYKDNEEKINEWMNYLKKEKPELVKKGFRFLNIVQSLVINIIQNAGKTVSTIIDLFNYTSLFIPIMDMIIGLIKNNPLPTVEQILTSMVVATGGFFMKKILNKFFFF